MPIWAEDGTVWLVPAYSFLSVDGGRYDVLAVSEDDLEEPAPTTTVPVTEPPVAEPAPTSPPASDPATTLSTPTPTDPPATTPSDLTCTGPNGEEQVSCLAVDVAARLVGLTEEEATKVAEEAGVTVRVVARDGEQLMVTADYSASRVNLSVQGGQVTAVAIS
jgi:hypothetical protein